ncbi:hypothetical protein FB45DRAFT_1018609 [Roridomyces roridus]|uniref:Uncharacterized protein n=1 Tax=Roridomyces roridus TaxID=1738132 RepID=A0AAD7CKT7_9AGAR|nr:hypothetical protein FB45DRAFT_1018609 [Roridomyces roridus]
MDLNAFSEDSVKLPFQYSVQDYLTHRYAIVDALEFPRSYVRQRLWMPGWPPIHYQRAVAHLWRRARQAIQCSPYYSTSSPSLLAPSLMTLLHKQRRTAALLQYPDRRPSPPIFRIIRPGIRCPGAYLKTVVSGVVALSVMVNVLFSVYWGFINAGANVNLTAAVSAVDGSDDSSKAITFIDSDDRIRPFHKASVATQLDAMAHNFACNPLPIYNTRAQRFDLATFCASAVTLSGIIELVSLSLFGVMLAATPCEVSGLEAHFDSVAEFFILLIYSLLRRASIYLSTASYAIFWMPNWLDMLASGLLLEAMFILVMLILVTRRFMPFLSVDDFQCLDLQVLPHVYRYGLRVSQPKRRALSEESSSARRMSWA